MAEDALAQANRLLVCHYVTLRANLAGFTRGKAYLRHLVEQTYEHLTSHGVSVPPPSTTLAPSAPTAVHARDQREAPADDGDESNVVPFVASRDSSLRVLCGDGFDEYQPLPPGGSV